MSKPLTSQEAMFRNLVSDLIRCKDIRAKEKEHRLINFWNQADYYYDIFCESVYMLMTESDVDALSIDDAGYSCFDIIVLNDDFYPGFELLTKADVRPDVDDLIHYVDIALSRLDVRINKLCKARPQGEIQVGII